MTCLCIEHDSYENVIGHAQGMPLWCAFEYGEPPPKKPFCDFSKTFVRCKKNLSAIKKSQKGFSVLSGCAAG